MDAPTLAVPLREDAYGVLRVGETRVRLDSVIVAWKQGESPEQIADNFDSLELADVYAVVSYYLHAREKIESYLDENRLRGERIRKTIETRSPQIGLRERLLARRALLSQSAGK